MRAKLLFAIGALVTMAWAVPNSGAAPFIVRANPQQSNRLVLQSVRFRLNRDRGLLLDAWLNGRGPYVFAVDTGAGMNLITERLVADAQLTMRRVRPTTVGGLTSATTSSNREAVISQLALGDRNNNFKSQTALVVSNLAQGVDGILDPADLYSPNGFSIDLPNERIEGLYSGAGERPGQRDAESAVVPWLRLSGSSRPFVRLGDGRLALIDTGSGFGLGVNQRNAVLVGARRNHEPQATHDIGGGMITSRRVSPTTISIGELVLRGVPTDILFGVEDNAPLILGRDALYPFKITFDPQKRLISFVASERI